MKDNYGRTIDYLRVSVTENCNLNCFYCMPDDKLAQQNSSELSNEKLLRIIKSSVSQGITKIRLTGGEPLVKKGIYQLIKSIREIKEITELTLTTNGTHLIGNVKKLKDLGVDRFNVSLDTLDPKEYQNVTKSNISLNYESLIREILEEEMFPLKLNVVLLRGINSHKINEFIDLANKYDINIRFIELMDIGSTGFDYNKYFISKDEILKMYPEIEFVSNLGNTSNYKVKNQKGAIGFINPVSDKFCDTCNRLRLTADGNIKPCLHSSNEIPIELDDDLYIQELIRNAINSKPKEHELDDPNGDRTKRSMNKIGG